MHLLILTFQKNLKDMKNFRNYLTIVILIMISLFNYNLTFAQNWVCTKTYSFNEQIYSMDTDNSKLFLGLGSGEILEINVKTGIQEKNKIDKTFIYDIKVTNKFIITISKEGGRITDRKYKTIYKSDFKVISIEATETDAYFGTWDETLYRYNFHNNKLTTEYSSDSTIFYKMTNIVIDQKLFIIAGNIIVKDGEIIKKFPKNIDDIVRISVNNEKIIAWSYYSQDLLYWENYNEHENYQIIIDNLPGGFGSELFFLSENLIVTGMIENAVIFNIKENKIIDTLFSNNNKVMQVLKFNKDIITLDTTGLLKIWSKNISNEEEEITKEISLSIDFILNEDNIKNKSESEIILQNIVDFWNQDKSKIILITGHAIQKNNSEYNDELLDLAKKRAEKIKALLITKGIDANKIFTNKNLSNKASVTILIQ